MIKENFWENFPTLIKQRMVQRKAPHLPSSLPLILDISYRWCDASSLKHHLSHKGSTPNFQEYLSRNARMAAVLPASAGPCQPQNSLPMDFLISEMLKVCIAQATLHWLKLLSLIQRTWGNEDTAMIQINLSCNCFLQGKWIASYSWAGSSGIIWHLKVWRLILSLSMVFTGFRSLHGILDIMKQHI